MDATELKTCSKCKTAKPATEFCNRAKSKDGLSAWCKACSYMAHAVWQKANREKHKANTAKWRANNPERCKASTRASVAKWSLANPEALRVKSHNRRALKRENGGRLSAGLAERLFTLQRGKCACGCKQPLGTDYHMDHRMPLALGGTNTDDNIQLLRKLCNQQKCAKHPVEFMQSRGFLL